jgi:hypothetical protein
MTFNGAWIERNRALRLALCGRQVSLADEECGHCKMKACLVIRIKVPESLLGIVEIRFGQRRLNHKAHCILIGRSLVEDCEGLLSGLVWLTRVQKDKHKLCARIDVVGRKFPGCQQEWSGLQRGTLFQPDRGQPLNCGHVLGVLSENLQIFDLCLIVRAGSKIVVGAF